MEREDIPLHKLEETLKELFAAPDGDKCEDNENDENYNEVIVTQLSVAELENILDPNLILEPNSQTQSTVIADTAAEHSSIADTDSTGTRDETKSQPTPLFNILPSIPRPEISPTDLDTSLSKEDISSDGAAEENVGSAQPTN